MTHDAQVHNLMHSLMDAYARAECFNAEYASTDEDIADAKKRMKAAKDGASHLLKGQIQEASDCLEVAKGEQ